MKALTVLVMLTSLCLSGFTKEQNVTVIDLTVTEKGFEPNKIDVKPDTSVKLNITRKTDNTCSTSIHIPDKKIKKDLPLNKTVSIDLGKLAKGEIRFGCGMNMMDSGMIYVK